MIAPFFRILYLMLEKWNIITKFKEERGGKSTPFFSEVRLGLKNRCQVFDGIADQYGVWQSNEAFSTVLNPAAKVDNGVLNTDSFLRIADYSADNSYNVHSDSNKSLIRSGNMPDEAQVLIAIKM